MSKLGYVVYISNFTLTKYFTYHYCCWHRNNIVFTDHFQSSWFMFYNQIFSLFYICIAPFKYFILSFFFFFFHWEIFSKIIFERHINFSGCNFFFFFLSLWNLSLEKCPRVYKICNKINITKPPPSLFVYYIYIYIIFRSIEVFHPFLNHV